MDILANISLGFSHAATLSNLTYCLMGVMLGTAVGVLPGLGPAAAISMLLPFTFSLEPSAALIMLAGIYYGSQYGGSTTAILLNLPGESSSVVTTLDGHQMAKRGRGGVALATAAIGSFIAGTFATLLIAIFAPGLAAVALKFGPAEYFALMVLGLIAAVALASGSFIKALIMVAFGLMLGLVGMDINTAASRYTFGFPELGDGLSLVAVAMGIFGLGEIIFTLGNGGPPGTVSKVTSLIPTKQDFKDMTPSIARGSLIGSALGILPGGGGLLAAFVSYAAEKKLSRNRAEFGKGAIEGVAGPESANNAGAQTSFIPLLTLGLPSNVIMALMAGAMIMHGIQPGPEVMTKQPDLFWGLIASMWIGNAMLLILNLPLVGLWVRLITIPYKILYPGILIFCCVGVYSVSNSIFDIYIMVVFGFIGYVLKKLQFEPAPLLLGMILGPLMEEYLRRALLLSRGDPMVFLQRPVSAALLALALLMVVMITLPMIRTRREEAFQE